MLFFEVQEISLNLNKNLIWWTQGKDLKISLGESE